MKRLCLLLIGAVWPVLCANSQGLTIAPIMIHAPASGGSVSMAISSTMPEPVTIQVRVFEWSQTDGEDRLSPSHSVRFAPEIFALSPGQAQTVRFLVPDTKGAGAWRVVVDELPSAGSAGTAEGYSQLNIRLRHVLAMFAQSAGVPSQLEAHLDEDALWLINPGPGWLKLHSLKLVDAQEVAVADAGPGLVYVLPGASVRVSKPEEEAELHALKYSVDAHTYKTSLRSVK